MLSKEELEILKRQVALSVECGEIQRGYTYDLLENIDVMQAQINKLEENATAQSLELKAAKAMQQAESGRADANERDAERYRYIRTKERMGFDTDDGEVIMISTFSSADEFDDAIDQAMSNL